MAIDVRRRVYILINVMYYVFAVHCLGSVADNSGYITDSIKIELEVGRMTPVA